MSVEGHFVALALKFAFTISKLKVLSSSAVKMSKERVRARRARKRLRQMQRAGTDSRDNLQQILPRCSSSQKTGVFYFLPPFGRHRGVDKHIHVVDKPFFEAETIRCRVTDATVFMGSMQACVWMCRLGFCGLWDRLTAQVVQTVVLSLIFR